MSRIFTTSVASVYPHYVTKVEKKGRTKAVLDLVNEWLSGFDEPALSEHLAVGLAERERLRLRKDVRHEQVVVASERVQGLREGDEVAWDQLRPLVDELVEGVLAAKRAGATMPWPFVPGSPQITAPVS